MPLSSSPSYERLKKRIAGRRRWLRDLPSRLALKLFNKPPVRVVLERKYGSALQNHERALPRLTGIEADIVSALKRDGVCITHIDALGLPGSDEVIRTAATLGENFAQEAHERTAKGEVYTIVTPDRVTSEPSIYTMGLQNKLLDIAEAYIGLPPAYDGVTINYTVADGREVATRQWHRDCEDRRMLKVIIYLHDVDEAAGPFQMIRQNDVSQDDATRFDYQAANETALLERRGHFCADNIVSCCGPAGTVVFTDTASFLHRAKPATGRDRMSIFYSYFAQNPRHPFLCERTGIRRRDVTRLTKYLPQRQQHAARWHDRLAFPLRMIPSAKV